MVALAVSLLAVEAPCVIPLGGSAARAHAHEALARHELCSPLMHRFQLSEPRIIIDGQLLALFNSRQRPNDPPALLVGEPEVQ